MHNRVELIGHLGADPEIRKTQSGDTVANMRLATTERWRDDKGVKHEKTEWHTLVLWSRLAEVAEKYLKKGALVHVTGKLQTRKWTKDDQDHYSTEIVVSNLIMLDKKRDDREPGENG